MQRALLVFGLLAVVAAAATLAIGLRQTPESAQSIGQEAPWDTPSMAGQVIGKRVRNQEGQDLGRVIALAAREGHISYILISKPGRREWIPVPPGAAYLETRQHEIILKGVDPARMAAAPGLNPDEPQMLEDPYFESEVRSYYGVGGPAPGQ